MFNMTENVELDEQMSMFDNEKLEITETSDDLSRDDEFKEAVYSRMRKVHTDGMVLGFQTACHTALDKIYAFERSVGKKSANDYKRCIKDLKKFFEIGISRKVNSDETAEQEEISEV
jgi:hypothetical protein